MKKQLFFVSFLFITLSAAARDKDSTLHYNLPDSVRAIQFMAELKVQNIAGRKESHAGIKTDAVSLSIESDKKGRAVEFEFPDDAEIIVTGWGARSEKGEIEFVYDWKTEEMYKLMIAVASDSAENFSLFSGYVFFPKENGWKLIGTCRINGRWKTLQQPTVFYSSGKKAGVLVQTGQVWCQRSNGSWKNLKEDNLPAPVINYFGHIDSISRRQADIKMIEDSIAAGKTGPLQNRDGVYYSILKEGTGRQVSVNDTVVAFYKGSLFSSGTVFDQTKEKPATFPLNRLIRGWQTGVPLCKVGGKIRLVIPSDLAYSIRTRAAKIPPNSILVFEVEVVEARPPQ